MDDDIIVKIKALYAAACPPFDESEAYQSEEYRRISQTRSDCTCDLIQSLDPEQLATLHQLLDSKDDETELEKLHCFTEGFSAGISLSMQTLDWLAAYASQSGELDAALCKERKEGGNCPFGQQLHGFGAEEKQTCIDCIIQNAETLNGYVTCWEG